MASERESARSGHPPGRGVCAGAGCGGGGSGGRGAQRGEFDRFEFLRYVLVKTGRLEEEDVDDSMFLFHQYDLDGSGKIDIEDVRIFEKQSERGSYRVTPYGAA